MRAVPVVSNRRVICGPITAYAEEDILAVVSRADVMNVVPASVAVINRVNVSRPDNPVEDSAGSATNDVAACVCVFCVSAAV